MAVAVDMAILGAMRSLRGIARMVAMMVDMAVGSELNQTGIPIFDFEDSKLGGAAKVGRQRPPVIGWHREKHINSPFMMF